MDLEASEAALADLFERIENSSDALNLTRKCRQLTR